MSRVRFWSLIASELRTRRDRPSRRRDQSIRRDDMTTLDRDNNSEHRGKFLKSPFEGRRRNNNETLRQQLS